MCASVPRTSPAGPPTVRQVYALARALCEKVGEPFPDRRDDASDLIARIRREIGHPEPELPPRRGRYVSR